MDLSNPYITSILISLVVIISYLFNQFSKKTNVPSVILLIGLGYGVKMGLEWLKIDTGERLFQILEILGIVGLIMIVLEAALDLHLTKDKTGLIVKSFFVGLLGLAGCTFGIAYLFYYFLLPDFFQALLYAVPLSIMSSAIIIPSVGSLIDEKKEFLIYESTFSDILGIMLFYFLLGNAETKATSDIVLNVTTNIVATVVMSIVVSYGLVLLFQRLESGVKLFFLIAVLVVLYAVGKLFHLSSLLIIMVFGLVLTNHKLFFPGKLRRLLNLEKLGHVLEDFHVVTMESAFVVRTFFFVIFGMTLNFQTLLSTETALISMGVVGIIFGLRFIFLKMFQIKNIFPELLIAPRGLITVLLFFSIPAMYQSEVFRPGILLYTILISSFIMSGALIANASNGPAPEELSFDWDSLDKEIETLQKTETQP